MANVAPGKYDLKKCTLTLRDGQGTPEEIEMKFDEGNLTFTHNRNIEYVKDRGALDAVREGDEEPMSLSFQGRFNCIKSSSGNDLSVYEFLTNTGATTLTTTGQPCDPFAVDVVLTRDNSGCQPGVGDVVQDEEIVFEEFRHESIDGDIRAGQISVSGKCNRVHPTSTRSTPP